MDKMRRPEVFNVGYKEYPLLSFTVGGCDDPQDAINATGMRLLDGYRLIRIEAKPTPFNGEWNVVGTLEKLSDERLAEIRAGYENCDDVDGVFVPKKIPDLTDAECEQTRRELESWYRDHHAGRAAIMRPHGAPRPGDTEPEDDIPNVVGG